VNLLAEIMHVPSVLIVRAEPHDIKAFLSSKSKRNPHEVASLNTGLYCGTVMKTRQTLLVPDARQDDRWRSSPEIELGMISYLGVPISWPDGKIFGTICVYDNKRNEYSEPYLRLMLLWRDVLQADLRTLATQRRRPGEREIKIRRLVDANIIGICVYDWEGRILEANDAFLRMVGYDREELAAEGIRWRDITASEWHDRDARVIRKYETGLPDPDEKELIRKDGSRVPVLLGSATFEEDANQGVSFVLDLTARKRAEEALRESEERFRTLVQFSFDVYWETDAQHRFIRQEFAEALTEAPVSEIGRSRWEVPYLEPDAEAWRKHRETLDAHLPFRDFELARPTPNGGKRYVSVSGLPLFDETGRFIGYRGVGRHITERKRAEEALRESEARFRTFVDHATDTFMLHNEIGIVLDVNRNACESLGYSRDELIGMTPFFFDLELNAATWQHNREHLRAGGIATLESRYRRKDGTVFPVEVRMREFCQGRQRLIISLSRDITERKRAAEAFREMQAELTHANRAAAVGQVTASVAHEVSQPITAMLCNAEAALRWLGSQPANVEEVRRALASIVTDANRAGDVINWIRALIKKTPARKESIDVNSAILDVVTIARSELLRHGVSLQTYLTTGLPLIEGHRVQLQQVFLNLILNAVEAMSCLDEGARELRISTSADASNGVLVAVRDSGPGLDAKTVNRLFEPFYTTKPEGMGMGLAICHSIIEAHGGRLWAGANEPRGAVFQFTLRPEQE
jgi:PAS domain S-box-containing protein